MKTTTKVIAALVALLSLSAYCQRPSYDQLLQRIDKNENGSLEKKEFNRNPNLFQLIDQNKDGVVTRTEFDAAEKPSREPRKRAYRNPSILDGVVVHPDLEYAVEDEKSLKLDLYLPETKNPPLLVWIHGGGWKNGDKANVNPAILQLTSEGYAVASINYRLKDLSIHPKNIHDCKGALRWLRANAATYGYDPNRVAVGGSSAGGHLSLLLGMSSGVAALEGTVGGNTNQSTTVKAIIDLYGPSELTVMAETQGRFNRAHDFEPDLLNGASPLQYLTPDDPPILILHGDLDKIVPVEQSKLLHMRYQEAGLESTLHIVKDEGHGGREFSDDTRYLLIKSFLGQHLGIPE